jgi:hypothetical protein
MATILTKCYYRSLKSLHIGRLGRVTISATMKHKSLEIFDSREIQPLLPIQTFTGSLVPLHAYLRIIEAISAQCNYTSLDVAVYSLR